MRRTKHILAMRRTCYEYAANANGRFRTVGAADRSVCGTKGGVCTNAVSVIRRASEAFVGLERGHCQKQGRNHRSGEPGFRLPVADRNCPDRNPRLSRRHSLHAEAFEKADACAAAAYRALVTAGQKLCNRPALGRCGHYGPLELPTAFGHLAIGLRPCGWKPGHDHHVGRGAPPISLQWSRK